MTVDVEEVKNDLLEALEHDKLVLPTLPEIALQVREAANDPNTDIPRLQDLIGNDAVLSARVVRVANSPLERGVQAIAPDLGVKILESWNFHPSLAHVPKDHLDYHRDSDQVDYIDIVVVARLQSYGYEAGCGRRISSREVPAVAKLGLEVDDSEDLELGLHIEEIDMAVESLQ